MEMLTSIAAPILVIGALIFVHELGHFLLAKFCGVGVVKFAIGFGPALLRFKWGETIYQLGLIPLGGFVRMVGDMPDSFTGAHPTDEAVREEKEDVFEEVEGDSEQQEHDPELEAMLQDRSRWFIEKSYWQRFSIVFAGPLFNFLFSIFVIFIAVALYGRESFEERPIIGAVMEGSPAAEVGLASGDLVTSVSGKEIDSWEALADLTHNSDGRELVLDVVRGESELQLTVAPKRKEVPLLDGSKEELFLIGIQPTTVREHVSLFESLYSACAWTISVTGKTYEGLWGMMSGQVSPNDIAGPIFILGAASKQAEEGFENILFFTAVLSVSLAVLNLLPIPILDGGHLLVFTIEALLGPISIRKKEFAQQIGMAFLLLLMLFAVHNDLSRPEAPSGAMVDWEEGAAEAEE